MRRSQLQRSKYRKHTAPLRNYAHRRPTALKITRRRGKAWRSRLKAGGRKKDLQLPPNDFFAAIAANFHKTTQPPDLIKLYNSNAYGIECIYIIRKDLGYNLIGLHKSRVVIAEFLPAVKKAKRWFKEYCRDTLKSRVKPRWDDEAGKE